MNSRATTMSSSRVTTLQKSGDGDRDAASLGQQANCFSFHALVNALGSGKSGNEIGHTAKSGGFPLGWITVSNDSQLALSPSVQQSAYPSWEPMGEGRGSIGA